MRRHRRPFQRAGHRAAFRPAGQPIPTVDTQPLLRSAVHHPSTTEEHRPREIRNLRAQVEEQMNLVVGYLHRVVLLELRDFNQIANFDSEEIQRDVMLNWIDMVNFFLAGRQLPALYVTRVQGQRALSGNAIRDATWFAEQMHTTLFSRVVTQEVRAGRAFPVADQNDTYAITSNHNRAMTETLARLLRTMRHWGDQLQTQITDRESEIRNDARGWREYDEAWRRLDEFLRQQRGVLAQVRAGTTTNVTIESGLGNEGARPLHGDTVNDSGDTQGTSAPGGSRDTAVQLD